MDMIPFGVLGEGRGYTIEGDFTEAPGPRDSISAS
jgi:hypothetical protein